jgi:hypothetical protein
VSFGVPIASFGGLLAGVVLWVGVKLRHVPSNFGPSPSLGECEYECLFAKVCGRRKVGGWVGGGLVGRVTGEGWVKITLFMCAYYSPPLASKSFDSYFSVFPILHHSLASCKTRRLTFLSLISLPSKNKVKVGPSAAG